MEKIGSLSAKLNNSTYAIGLEVMQHQGGRKGYLTSRGLFR